MALDIEQRFISALLRAPRNEQESFFDKQIPVGVFKLREAEAYWVFQYREKKGSYPTPAVFYARFRWRVKKVKESVTDSLEAVVDQDQYRAIKDAVERTRELIDLGRDMKEVVGFYKDAAQNISTYEISTEDVDFAKSRGTLVRYAKLRQLKNTKGGALFTTPWPTINRVIKFTRPQELAVVQGRLGMGKTYFLAAWALYLAMIGNKILFISKEMGTDAIVDRFELMRYRINPDKFRDGTLTQTELRQWERQRMKQQSLDLIINGSETLKGTGFNEIFSLVSRYKPQVVFIDAAYRIVLEGEGKNRWSDVEKFTRIAQTAKRGAKATKTFFCISIQMNRGAEDKQGNTKGGVINAYGSDAWLQEADLGIAINGKRNQSDIRELDILKSRDSGTGSVLTNFKFNPFIDLSEANKSQLALQQPGTQFRGI